MVSIYICDSTRNKTLLEVYFILDVTIGWIAWSRQKVAEIPVFDMLWYSSTDGIRKNGKSNCQLCLNILALFFLYVEKSSVAFLGLCHYNNVSFHFAILINYQIPI
jgi:hypothetical protein